MHESEEISGLIDRILFQNPESGYSVFVLKLSTNHEITITGHVPSIQPGQQINVVGYWIVHSKFGRQFQAVKCTLQLPTTLVGIEKYLGSGLIKGIGKVYAQKIVARFGEQTLTVLEQSPEKLQSIGGIGPKRLEQIKDAWESQKAISSIMIFLQEKSISPIFATKIYKQYGQQAIAVITENPYRLAEDIWGVGFKSADSIAEKIGIAKDSIKRVKAALLFLITQATSQGHLYIEITQLKNEAKILLDLSDEHDFILKNALHELYDIQKIKLISHQEKHFVTLTQYYFSEKGFAARILELVNHKSLHKFDIQKIYLSLRLADTQHVALNEDQQRAILSSLAHKVSIITGGPGTGKTTLIKRLLSILDEHQIIYKLTAPTGRAAKRIIEGTGRYAVTIHRLMEFEPTTMRFLHNEKNAIKADFLIVDEASMIDIFLAHALVKAVSLDTHIIFIGDIDQLPSVGAGNVLSNLLESGIVPWVKLTHIFRQSQDSLIILNAHRINQGEFPVSTLPHAKKDFIFIKEQKAEFLTNHLSDLYSKKTLLAPYTNDSIVLVPMNRGVAGTIKLNQDLQQILNPHASDQLLYSGTLFKVHDKVMQIRNNYDKSVFNGDIGIISAFDHEVKMVYVRFDERTVEYEFHELNELVLAYAISIHKSQGSEYAAVIVPLFMQHFMLLQRNLIYTAITRAKKLCIFIGQPKALAIGLKNNKTNSRQTFLTQFLTTDLTCR